MGTVIHVNEEQQRVVDVLREMLGRAESGELTAVAIAGLLKNEGACNVIAVASEASNILLLGELRLLERDYIDCFTQTRRQPAWEYCE